MECRGRTAPVDVALLAVAQTTPTSLNALFEVFSSVGVAWTQLTGEETDVRRITPRIVTGGGPGAWEDLALYLVAHFCGTEEARRIAKVFVLGDRSDGQLVFFAMGRPKAHHDGIIGECQLWLADHYAETHPVRRMVERSGLAERTFKRRFRTATGYTPLDYTQALRIEEAKQMLESTRLPTEEVACSVGYEDPAYFRQLFRRRTGVTPSQYRRRFEPAVFLKHR